MRLKILFFFFLFSGSALQSKAQLATIDTKRVFASMPVFAKIDTLVQSEAQRYGQEYLNKKLRAQLLVTAADSLNRVAPKGENAKKVTHDAQVAIEEFKDYEAASNQKIAKYKEFLLKPYEDRVNKAIRLVAKRDKYKQVIDIQQGSFAYVDPAGDITEAVIAVLQEE